MKYVVVAARTTDYPHPIRLAEGSRVLVGQKYAGHAGWEGWIWCKQEGRQGWVPDTLIHLQPDGTGTVTEAYDATELTVKEGDVIVVTRETNGWYWGRNQRNNETGWIPAENVRPLNGP